MVDLQLVLGFYLLSTALLMQNVNMGRVAVLGNGGKAAKWKKYIGIEVGLHPLQEHAVQQSLLD